MLANRVFTSIPAGSPYPKKIKFEGGSPVKDNTGAVTVLIDASGTPTANNPKPADKAAPAAPAANNTGNQVSKQPSGYVQGTDTKDVVINGQKIMGLGSKGDLVKFVQHKMSKKYPDLAAGISKDTACSTDQTKCDGIFGKNTMAAVAKFQTEKNLQGRKNGVIGKITFPEIEKL
jgi:hypothetical protein